MKNFLFALAACLLVACVSDNPKSVARHFIEASLRMDFKEARKYATPETQAMIDFLENVSAKTKQNPARPDDTKVEIISEVIEGDHATVTYKKAGSTDEYSLDLKKVNGKWLVALTLGNLTGK